MILLAFCGTDSSWCCGNSKNNATCEGECNLRETTYPDVNDLRPETMQVSSLDSDGEIETVNELKDKLFQAYYENDEMRQSLALLRERIRASEGHEECLELNRPASMAGKEMVDKASGSHACMDASDESRSASGHDNMQAYPNSEVFVSASGKMSEIEEEMPQLIPDDILYALPEEEDVPAGPDICMLLIPIGTGWPNLITFTLGELKIYTEDFNKRNEVGSGGFGHVYKGVIMGRAEGNLNGNEVAIKVTASFSTRAQLRRAAFRNLWEAEVTHLPRFAHPNIIQLIGKCETTKRSFLVYPFMPKGSVQKNLAECDAMLGRISLVFAEDIFFNFASILQLLLDWTPVLFDFSTVVLEGSLYPPARTRGYTDRFTLQWGKVRRKCFTTLSCVASRFISTTMVVNVLDNLRETAIDWERGVTTVRLTQYTAADVSNELSKTQV
ncbi:hypothetical protein RJ639_014321 [Escallonia herrerae]|uniref:Protein kinase domain-containing protein n=1 Tax=Escallonia herrerae TaxID=1293975 RepID=A0AA88VJK5_9ASTE|nr:hypothetical protein RJ639_014321 [Escallonia herrerae]